MTFCAAPFVHMVHNPNGQFRTCCMYEKPFKGDYKNIQEAFESEENKIIRQRMLSGEKLPECAKCDIDEKHGGKRVTSYRQFFNQFKDYVNNPVFKTLEISVSNKCNFKCIDCDERFSNRYGPTIENELPEANFFNELVELKILGGEPFLDKRNYDLLKQVPKNIKLMLVTNCSIFPKQEMLDLLLEFKFLNINLSIDGIRDVAEYVRSGTKWSRFERNWNKWIEWGNKLGTNKCHMTPHFVIHSLNAPFFEETFKWSDIDLSWWSWDFLTGPEWLNISFLPDHLKKYILDENEILKEPIEAFLKTNKHDKNLFYQLVDNAIDTPPAMEDYIERFYARQ